MHVVFATFIRDLRVARAMTQADLAEASGIDQPNISAIENGRRTPSAATLQRLVESCGFDLAAVAGERVIAIHPDDDHAPTPPPPEMTVDERRRALVAALDLAEAVVRSRSRSVSR